MRAANIASSPRAADKIASGLRVNIRSPGNPKTIVTELPADATVGHLELAIRRGELAEATRGKRVRLIAGGKLLRRDWTLKASGVADATFVHCAISEPLPPSFVEARAAARESEAESAPLVPLDPDVLEARRLQMLELGIVADGSDDRWLARFESEWARANGQLRRGVGTSGADEAGEREGGAAGGGELRVNASAAQHLGNFCEFVTGLLLGFILGPFALMVFFYLRFSSAGFSRRRSLGILVGILARSVNMMVPLIFARKARQELP
jgi:hypothetical protein